MDNYPYMIANNKIAGILENIRSAAKPNKFNKDLLVKMGFTSSNDLAVIPLLRRLNFLSEDNAPTSYYDELRDPTRYQIILADRIRNLYADLYQINTNIHSSPDADVKGAFSRITGKDETTVTRFFNTFKTLTGLANFNASTQQTATKTVTVVEPETTTQKTNPNNSLPKSHPQFHYNIQVHLPATTDISVYNAIFKSLKENLLHE